jgi:hypothetical protein
MVSDRVFIDVRIRLRRDITIATIVSILVHIGVLFIPMRQPEMDFKAPGQVAETPLTVRIAPPKQAQAQVVPVTPPEPSPVPTPEPRTKRTVTIPAPPPLPAPPVAQAEPRPTPPVDMMAAVNAARERRQTAEAAIARENESSRERYRDRSPAEAATAALNRNLQTIHPGFEGTGGIFQILTMGHRSSTFAFNGWKVEAKKQWREVIEVEAPPQGDIQLATVRRMIQLIRQHYSGDFNWESQRLGRVVTLSARVEDSAGLEEFMMREFFGTPPLVRSR